jgi:hypothetical protein
MAEPVFFETPEVFRAWLARHAHSAAEIVVGFHKVDSGRAAQPPGYRKRLVWRILSAKQRATHDKRLAALIEASAKGERMP